MNTHKLLDLFVIAFIGMVVTCPFQLRNDSDLAMPLSINNSWTYEMDRCASDSLCTFSKDTWMITADSVIQGERWYCMKDRGWFTNRRDGVYLWLRGRHDPGLFIAVPSKIGTSFRNSYGDSTVLVAEGVQVKVKAGEFRCYAYRSFQSAYKYVHGVRQVADSCVADIYFAPGVGMVRLDIFDVRGGKNPMRQQDSLLEYKIN